MPEGLHPSTHPPLPPTTEDDRVLWLRLLRSRRVGIATFFRLLSEHGSPAAALDALPEIARAAGVERYQTFCEEAARAELSRGADAGATSSAMAHLHTPKRCMIFPIPPRSSGRAAISPS